MNRTLILEEEEGATSSVDASSDAIAKLAELSDYVAATIRFNADDQTALRLTTGAAFGNSDHHASFSQCCVPCVSQGSAAYIMHCNWSLSLPTMTLL